MSNPANKKEKAALPPGYQPMSAATKKLDVPEREGFHRRWIRGEPGRIAKAQRAGYVFVENDAVTVNNRDLGGDAKQSGNTDLGTRVSVISGDGVGFDGQPDRLYLMECPLEYYEYSRSLVQERNQSVADALTTGRIGIENEEGSDAKQRYMGDRSNIPDFFNSNKRKRRS